jgi:hypothetical protein
MSRCHTMQNRTVKIVISGAALGLFILRADMPNLLPSDALSLSLLVVIILPWLSSFIDMAELPGGWKVQFRELKQDQNRQKEEIDSLRFLISGFLTDYELIHLKKLNIRDSFPYERNSRFISELRRLHDLGLITKVSPVNIGDLPPTGYLKGYIKITERGKTYLRLRSDVEETDHGAS